MENTGWRKPTPGLLQAEKLAEAGEQLTVSKAEAIVAFKRVAAVIGARAGELMLIDTLAAFTQPVDWQEGARAIVWPSNDYLMQQTGYSRSGLKLCLKRLAMLGLIAFRDSSNGKRWGRRDDEGRIVEAYGIDLTPLASRAGEFAALYASICEERLLVKGLKRRLTILRRSVRALLEGASEHAPERHFEVHLGSAALNDLWERFHVLLNQLEAANRLKGKPGLADELIHRLMELEEAFGDLKERIIEATTLAADMPASDADFTPCSTSSQMPEIGELSTNSNPREPADKPHIRITNQLNSVKSNIIEKRRGQGADIEPNQPTGVKGTKTANQNAQNSQIKPKSETEEVELATVMQACPDFAEIAHGLSGYVRNWAEFSQVASQIRPMAGISQDAWDQAQQSVGPHLSAAMLALIYDKYSKGEVSSPGGYLRGMIDKAKCGELNLARSFYGRLNETRGSV